MTTITKQMDAGWRPSRALILALFGVAACSTPDDFADGIKNFSGAVAAADNAGQALEAGAQQSAQNSLLRSLPRIDPRSVLLSDKCKADAGGYHAGDCALLVNGNNVGNPGAPPSMAALSKYAAALSAIVADQNCAALQTDSQGLAASISDIAEVAGGTNAAEFAGPISQIASTTGCAAISAEQLRILRTSTTAADPIIQKDVPLIADAYTQLYLDALNDAHTQALADLVDYENAQASYQRSKSSSDLDKSRSSITQVISLTTAIDRARSTPPGPVIAKIASLHQTLTKDLQSPTVSLKRVVNDAQAFIAQAEALTTAAEALANAKGAQAAPKSAH